MDLIGKLILIDDVKEISASFKKRDVAIETDEQYPQKILIEFTQDKCDLLNNYKLDDVVKIAININGREWINPQGEKKYFNSLRGSKVEKVGQAPKSTSAVDEYQNKQQTTTNPQSTTKEEEHDDLPF
ncbi:DUF3127 domain-containing protein [Flavobacterium psychrophilum]|uniref:single strand DNA binding protein n=1 Tax=Flavobacterium phage Fpv7 TaxID=1814287 RepID=UPI00078E023F|nr:DUF3127 domain-containing protein [Flavobacterium psychrophilum]YP_009321236.1 single strand DNA binding protein [Flavobacterium phage Fpv7]YP_009322302.1 single strand DNA binding protein [Flavobacterium phage Fpv8]YP_009322408.1 single strand DNA binding protein [Flavobacterium phage Fpv5]YP_009323702.1 single strand DNA binding protein [Flavobacterium phage Fpv10]YP_009324554.1 single strand DNA binding protein [Flavobacterium phage Fpv6]YP_009325242.1 single strand DNA binding protein 